MGMWEHAEAESACLEELFLNSHIPEFHYFLWGGGLT